MGLINVKFEGATKLAGSLSSIAEKLLVTKKLIETSGNTLSSNWPESSKGLYEANLKNLLSSIETVATLYQETSIKVSITVANYKRLLEKYKIGG